MFNHDVAMTLYLLGHWSVAFCGIIVLLNYWVGNATNDVSKDLQILTALSTVLRWFWSTDLSKDAPIFKGAVWIFGPLCYLELIVSTAVWLAVVLLVKHKDDSVQSARLPWYVRWYSCLLWALMGPALLVFNPGFWNSHVHFTLEAYTVPWNLCLDTFSILPQLYLLHSASSTPPRWVSHIVGLMCLDRVCLVMFWICYFWNGPYLISFILPDVLHSFFMLDYMYVWAQLVRSNSAKRLGDIMSMEGGEEDCRSAYSYTDFAYAVLKAAPQLLDAFLSAPTDFMTKVANNGLGNVEKSLEMTNFEQKRKDADAPEEVSGLAHRFHAPAAFKDEDSYDEFGVSGSGPSVTAALGRQITGKVGGLAKQFAAAR